MFTRLRRWLGRQLADYITQPVQRYAPFSVHDEQTLARFLLPGDVLLVEGNLRISSAIKFLTQSTWSHAAMYVGNAIEGQQQMLVEADLQDGVAAVPLAKYRNFNTRICRPVGLNENERQNVVETLVRSIGKDYDLKHVVDLARYLMPTPPVPVRWRRRLLSLGSDDPTRAICSTLIATAFQNIHYPILPSWERDQNDAERLRHRDARLFTPRDFDLSPYFRVIKPTIESGFDHSALNWMPTDQGEQTVDSTPSE